MAPKLTKYAAEQTRRFRAVCEIAELLRPQGWLFATGFFLMAINRITGLVLPSSTKFLVDDVILKRQTRLLLPLVLIVLGATAVEGLTSFALTQLLSKATQRLIADLKLRVQEHLGRLPVSYFDRNTTGALVSRIMNDAEGLRNLLGIGSIDFVGALLTSVISFVVLLRLSPSMTGIAFGLLVAYGFGLWRAFHAMRPVFVQRSQITAEVAGRLTESLSGIRVVKGYDAEKREHTVFKLGVDRLVKNLYRTVTATSILSLSTATVMGVIGAGVMLMGARQILLGTLTLGGFFTYTVFFGYLMAPLFQIVGIGTEINQAIAGLERTRQVFAEVREDQDADRKTALQEIEGQVEFVDVSFGYSPAKLVLHHVSFISRPGTVTALVGASGAGKSTIAGLIAAFYRASSGSVMVDGVDLSTVQVDSYRTQLGVVLQDSFLFDGTIRENVAFARPHASEQEVLRACAIARVDEFAERFPQGYDTIVGERGLKLSGGQRQRISIARAILADPRILILDEATSNLDCESEALIQQGLSYLMRGRTTFVIAHRLSTIKMADQILVIENGAIVEHGTHASLWQQRGRYHDLYAKQNALSQNLFLMREEIEMEELASGILATN